MLMANSEKVVEFKIQINRQFHQMKRWILEQKTQKANALYLQTRKESKLARLEETDVIKVFVEYATKQGSKNAKFYYKHLTNCEYKAFFIIKEKFPNVREMLNINQLNKIKFADLVIKEVLIKGMEKGLQYKDIYNLAKEKMIQISEPFEKDIIPGIEFKPLKP